MIYLQVSIEMVICVIKRHMWGLTKCFLILKVYDCHDSSPQVDLEFD